MIVMKTNSLITYWSELFIHLLAPKRAVGLSVDQGSRCILTPKTVQSTSLSFQSVYYVHGCNGLTLGVLGVGHGIADNVLKENFQNNNNTNNNNNNFIYIALKSNNCPKRYLITK